ncbi:hypothetical protein H257_16581 [Aphanomyces astaci]|uniref:Uncharacterized protein n=1 Tax=Aphanomyces astaci TaxID=112090 RepID=W4FKG0_APHAT|nr:hypothetical protein H257_16581 [Aphanomyces astaci]ETV67203.1 hypothetical protein H257_16581 [Aphanomyces astaci]|eukprot:XP_009843368.1 hypothetical protein H257_16581 [Aphanomyces astaci]
MRGTDGDILLSCPTLLENFIIPIAVRGNINQSTNMMGSSKRLISRGGSTLSADQRQEEFIRLELARKRNTKTASTEAKLTSRGLRRSGRKSTQQRHHEFLLAPANRPRIEAIVARVSGVLAAVPYSTDFSQDDKEFVLNWVDEVDMILTAFMPCEDPRRDPLGRMVDKLSWVQHSYTCLAEAGVDAKALVAAWERDGVFDSDGSDDDDGDDQGGNHLTVQISFDDMEADSEFARKERLVRRKAAARIIRRNVHNGSATSYWSQHVEEFRLFGNTFYKNIDTPLVKAQTSRLLTDEAKAAAADDKLNEGLAGRETRLKEVMHLAQHVSTFKVDDAIRNVGIAIQKRRLLENRCAVKLQLKWRAYRGGKVKMMLLLEELKRRKRKAAAKGLRKQPSTHNEIAPPLPRLKTPEPQRVSKEAVVPPQLKPQTPPTSSPVVTPQTPPATIKPKTPDKSPRASGRMRPSRSVEPTTAPAADVAPATPTKSRPTAPPPSTMLKSTQVGVIGGRKGSILGSLVSSLADEKRQLDLQHMKMLMEATLPNDVDDDEDDDTIQPLSNRSSSKEESDDGFSLDQGESRMEGRGDREQIEDDKPVTNDPTVERDDTTDGTSAQRRKCSVVARPSVFLQDSTATDITTIAIGRRTSRMTSNLSMVSGEFGEPSESSEAVSGQVNATKGDTMEIAGGSRDDDDDTIEDDDEDVRLCMASWGLDENGAESQRRLESKLKSPRALKKSALMVVLANSLRKNKERSAGLFKRADDQSSSSSCSMSDDDDERSIHVMVRPSRYHHDLSTSRLCSFGGLNLQLRRTAAHADIVRQCVPFMEEEQERRTIGSNTSTYLPPDEDATELRTAGGSGSTPSRDPLPPKSPPRILPANFAWSHSCADSTLSLPRLPEAVPPKLETAYVALPGGTTRTTLTLPLAWKDQKRVHTAGAVDGHPQLKRSNIEAAAGGMVDRRIHGVSLQKQPRAKHSNRRNRSNVATNKWRTTDAGDPGKSRRTSRLTNSLPPTQFVAPQPSRITVTPRKAAPLHPPPQPTAKPPSTPQPVAAVEAALSKHIKRLPGSSVAKDPLEATMAAYIGMLYVSPSSRRPP